MAGRRARTAHRAASRPGGQPAPHRDGDLLPVHEAIGALLPQGGIRRGTVVGVSGASTLALAIGTRASAAGSWCAAVGARALGLLAVAELGFDLDRFVVAKTRDASDWARAADALLETCDVVLAWPPPRLSLKPAERLVAVTRERGAVLVVAETGWPGRIDLMLSAVRTEWSGLGPGFGRLRARRVEVAVSGRGAASRERRGVLWLPAPNGEIALAAGGVLVPGEGALAAR